MSLPQGTTKKIYSKKILAKRYSRLYAIFAIFSKLILENKVDHIIKDCIDIYHSQDPEVEIDEMDEAYFIKLARLGLNNRQQAVDLIAPYLTENWRFERLAKTVQAILILGVIELVHLSDIDSPIIINEYVELAKYLNHTGEAGFVNNILDKIAKDKLENL